MALHNTWEDNIHFSTPLLCSVALHSTDGVSHSILFSLLSSWPLPLHTAEESFAAGARSESDCEHETELTDPDTSPPRARAGNEHEKSQHCDCRSTPAPMHGTKGSNDTPLRQSLYEDSLDDTDEDLSDVSSDYGGSKQTKKLRLRASDRWQRYCAAKASEPAADPQWFDAEKALQRASAKNLHRFWNWVIEKLKHGKGGRKLKGTKKTSSLKSDWKYFQGYYRKVTGNGISEKMSEDVQRGMQSLADKHGLDNQPRENIPVYIEDMDLLLSVQRDPHGGPPVPTVDFRPEFIKRNLGMRK
ncbi:hypothetical protein AJ78_09064, partial [Emergomyces pasteurianus Ep9510]